MISILDDWQETLIRCLFQMGFPHASDWPQRMTGNKARSRFEVMFSGQRGEYSSATDRKCSATSLVHWLGQ